MAEQENSNIKRDLNSGNTGMNLERTASQLPKGVLSYALNAVKKSFDGNAVTYQNELGNELCVEFPSEYQLIGSKFISEKNKHLFFLANPNTGDSEIGYMDNNDCQYKTLINDPCLNFNINHPIHKVVYKITNCGTEIYWTDGYNNRRFLDLENLPYKTVPGTTDCNSRETEEIDCNKLNVQPNFSIPSIEVIDVVSGGNLTAGTVQFAVQYSDAAGNGYTSYYSVTNPLPVANKYIVSPEFNYPVGKSVVLQISNLEKSGYFEYFNLAVIKTVNNIPSVELVGTYFIDSDTKELIYSGQNSTQIRLTIEDIFQKFPQYDIAEDITAVQDVLIWKGLTSIDQRNYQKIANQITLQWETWRIPATEDYADEINAAKFRGYLRDEVYPFEIVFLLNNGQQTDGFHIPGRAKGPNEWIHPDVSADNPDFIGVPDPITNSLPYWKIYNTASVTHTHVGYTPYSDYKGPYQYGEFAYWESTERYPCNEEVWGELANQPIRHHKFPDLLVSPLFEKPTITLDSEGKYANLAIQRTAFFPIGVRVDISQIKRLIAQSDLPKTQKDSIVGFKIVRGNRDVHKSVLAKGILRNLGKYIRGEEGEEENYSTTTTSTSSSTTTTTTTTV